MRSINIFLLLVFLTSTCGIQVSNANSSPTNSADGSIKAYVDVGGGVKKPGQYEWFPGMTVVDAISAAGGFTDSTEHIAVITHSDGTREKFNADTFPYATKKPPLLKAGDVISVPKRTV
jgi:protein involved in polysaccharide export with SLBB domain